MSHGDASASQVVSGGPIVDGGEVAAKRDQNLMQVKIYSPFRVYFDGQAASLSAKSATGPFDILPRHHNFITLLEAGDITVRTSQGEQKFRISGGLMHVKASQVAVFLDV